MLDPRELDVCFCDPDALVDPARREAALAVLTTEERERVARFAFERDRRLHLAARALLRRSLARCGGMPATAWRFESVAGGRPQIVSPECPLHFSVSHTRGLAMVAVAAVRDLGVDAEAIPDAVPLDVVERSFTPPERDAVLGAPPPERGARFAEIWTLKEAYAKARGLGLALPLDAVGFEVSPARLVHGDDPCAWQIEAMRPAPSHRAAVCVRTGGDGPLRVRVHWDANRGVP